MTAPKPPDEAARIAALHRYDILDSNDETIFDDLARLAADICETPISLISFVDVNRQWFKARHGLSIHETPRRLSFCAHAILTPGRPFVVEDALSDPRFDSNDLVLGDPHIRFYAASPLVTPDDFALGTICVIDRVPRQLTPQQFLALQVLGKQVMQQLELLRVAAELSSTKAQLEGALLESSAARLQLEEALRRSERRFGEYMRTMPLIAFMKDTDGRLIYVNEAFEKAFDMKLADWYGKTDAEIWPPETASQLRANDLAVLLGTGAVALEESVLTPRGLQHWISYKFPLRDQGGLFLAGTALNITDRKRAEEQALQAQKMNAIGQLAAGVAHDFNNQLAVILSLTELLSLEIEQPKSRRYVESISAAARRSADLTKSLLAFARKGQFHATPIDLHSTINVTAELLERTIDKRVHVRRFLNASNAVIMGDRSQIESALLNLALNGRDAMPEGGFLDFETSVVLPAEIEANLREFEMKAEAYLRLSVGDSGEGMTDDVKRHLFEPFYTTKPVGKGVGMGLASVYGTMKAHQGAIGVNSEVGHGTTFQLYFPLEGAKSPTATPDVVTHNALKLCILVVDDEEMLRATLVDLLTRSGHTVMQAASGREAIDLYGVKRNEIDLVVLDMVMPGLGGKETFTALKQVNPLVRVLLTSGFSADGAVQGILGQGGHGFIQKPFYRKQLESAIAAIFP